MTPTKHDIDDIHHALGRPHATNKPSYRNYYCTEADGEIAKRFEALGLWELKYIINDGRDAIYMVNEAGIAVLEEAKKNGWMPYL